MDEVPRKRSDSGLLKTIAQLRERAKPIVWVVTTMIAVGLFVWNASRDYQTLKGRVEANEVAIEVLAKRHDADIAAMRTDLEFVKQVLFGHLKQGSNAP